ncbi:MAG TPA: ParA family protein [Bryobacteraceae bacterium]|nr:ParA family protein [Bryobacteraceae bacterium]
MTGLVVSNQRGGVGKTTTAINYAGYLARQNQRVLLIDADSQGSINSYLGLKPTRFIANLIVNKEPLTQCVTPYSPRLDVLCSNRETAQAEAVLLGQVAREMALKLLLKPAEALYDFVIIDVAPSITLLQTCALVFARHVVVPLDMDMLSVQGAQMAVESARMLNDIYGIDIRVVGFLPTQVNHRHGVTSVVQSALQFISTKMAIPILPEIRTDQTVHKAARSKQFLFDFDSRCKAAEDYEQAFETLTKALEDRHGHTA